jgi:hypothetical protein
MTFARLRAWDWVALIAAVAILFVMAADWYSTRLGEEARRIERNQQTPTPAADEAQGQAEEAAIGAEAQEKNAWQADGGIDRLVLIMLLGTVALTAAAASLRASGRHYEPPWTPSSLAAIAATLTAALVLYRIVQERGTDAVTVVKAGAPLAIAVLGVVALAAAKGVQHEEKGSEFRAVEVE